MSDHSEDDLWDMDDSELKAAFKEAQAQENSPETEIEEVSAELETDAGTEEEEEFDTSETTDDDGDTDEDEEKTDDGSEQPEGLLEDSDHDSSDEEEAEEVDEDNTTESEDANPDGDTETDNEESSDETEEAKTEEQPTRNYSFKANGKDYEFSSDEIVDQFPKIFGKAMDYTKKMQAIKPWRKTIDAIEGAKISHDDVGLMIDVLKGDKDAINEVLKRTGTDTLELNTEEDSNYVVKDYGRDESALAISDVVDEISKDVEYATTQSILEKEWDEKSWEAMSSDPEKIRLLHTDVKSGMYKTLQPVMEKMKVFDGNSKSDLEYYAAAAQQYSDKLAKQKTFSDNQAIEDQKAEAAKKASEEKQARVAKAKAESDKRSATKKASVKRKAAAPTKSASADRVVDYLDESDENFDEWYSKLQDSM